MTDSTNKIDQAAQTLAHLSTREQRAILDQLEAKRRDAGFARYWEPITPGQWHAVQALRPETKILIVRGGNRSGKTEIGGAIAAAYFLGKKYFEGERAWEWVKDLPIDDSRPRNIWVVGLDFNAIRDIIWREKLRQGRTHPAFIPNESDPTIKKINDADFQIFGSDGSVITGKSADSGRDKFQGASVDLVWIDEEPEVEIFDECYQRTVDCGGRLLVTLTPLKDISSGVRTPWVHDLVEASAAGQRDITTVSLSVLDNPIISAEEKQKLIEKWAGHPEERARLYGEFIQRAGLVYNTWNPKVHMVKPFPIPAHWRRVVGIDPAATGPTAVLWAAVHPQTNDLYFYREYKEANLTVREHSKNILVKNAGDQIDIWLIDPKWGTQRNNETHRTGMQLYRDEGIPARLAPLEEDFGREVARNYIDATVASTKRGPKAYFFADLHQFRHEVERYTWDFFQRGELKGLSKEKPRKGNDDLMNALQFICAFRPKGRAFTIAPNPSIMEGDEQRRYLANNSYS